MTVCLGDIDFVPPYYLYIKMLSKSVTYFCILVLHLPSKALLISDSDLGHFNVGELFTEDKTTVVMFLLNHMIQRMKLH